MKTIKDLLFYVNKLGNFESSIDFNNGYSMKVIFDGVKYDLLVFNGDHLCCDGDTYDGIISVRYISEVEKAMKLIQYI